MSSERHTATLTIQTDIRLLAAIGRWYKRHNSPALNRNQLMHMIVRDFHSILVSNKQLTPITSITEALATCLDLGLGNMQKSHQPTPAFVEGLRFEAEFLAPKTEDQPLNPSDIAEAMRLMMERKDTTS